MCHPPPLRRAQQPKPGAETGRSVSAQRPRTGRARAALGGLFPTCLRQTGARAYLTSKQRAHDLPVWAHRYHWHRPHSGIKEQTPIGHLNLNQNNLLRLHIYHLHPCRRMRQPFPGRARAHAGNGSGLCGRACVRGSAGSPTVQHLDPPLPAQRRQFSVLVNVQWRAHT